MDLNSMPDNYRNKLIEYFDQDYDDDDKKTK